MAAETKLTNNSDETTIQALLVNRVIYEIPFFQRPYKWDKKRLQQLDNDLQLLVDELTDIHFLGAIIIHGRRSNPSDPKVYEVIDGQQRLTTLYLHLCAIVRTLVELDQYDEAARMFDLYLVTSPRLSNRSNLKLQPSREDRSDLNKVIQDLLNFKDFGNRERLSFFPLPGTGSTGGQIAKNHKEILKYYRSLGLSENGLDLINDHSVALLQKLSVVQIDVTDPTNGPKIFNSLNSQQQPMSTGDLVRNDVFTRLASEDPQQAIELEETYWRPFYEAFRDEKNSKINLFDDYFFPFGLVVHNPNLRKSEAYLELRKRWQSLTPEEVISDLKGYQEEFLDLERGTNSVGHPKDVADAFERLHAVNAPSSTFPFLMRLSHEIKLGSVPTKNAIQVLNTLESFFIRRSVCGVEPTGLHAVFKRLWIDCEGDVDPENVTSNAILTVIAEKPTVAWPNNSEVKQAVITRDVYGRSAPKYTRFILIQYDRSLKGDKAPYNCQVEHVLPQKLSPAWSAFTRAEHNQMVNVLANLLPLSAPMNAGLGNDEYTEKRRRYRNDSVYKSAREFAQRYDEWNPENLRKRAEHLAEWFVERWPDSPEDS